ncbi:hypothetical protein SprV_0401397300 [Sparganum proliferum]
MHFISSVSTITVHEIAFADNCSLNTTSEEEMQRSMDLFSAASENFGLVINTQKTVVMHQPPPNAITSPNAPPPQTSVNGTQLQVVENFPYLGSTLSRNTKIDDEPANQKFDQYATRTHNRYLRVLGVNGHSALESDFLDVFGPTAPFELYQPSSPPPASSSSSLPPTYADNSSERPLTTTSSSSSCTSSSSSSASPSSSSSSSSYSSPSSFFSASTAQTAAAQAAVSHITNPATTTATTPTASDCSDEGQDYACPHCDRTSTSHIGLVGYLRIHRTETGEPVPGAPTCTHQPRLNCPHCPRTFRHCMGLFVHMRIHE